MRAIYKPRLRVFSKSTDIQRPIGSHRSDVNWESLAMDIRDLWYHEPCNPDNTEQVSNFLSMLIHVIECRGPAPVDLIRSSFYCGLLVEIFASLRSEDCREKALRLICHALSDSPETLPFFLECDLPRVMLTFLEHVDAMAPGKRDTSPYQVLRVCETFTMTEAGVQLFVAEFPGHMSFFNHFLSMLDRIVVDTGETWHVTGFPQITESKIYTVYGNVARWEKLDSSFIEVVMTCYARAFEMGRVDSWVEICVSLKALWVARPDRHDLIFAPRISQPILAILRAPADNPPLAIPAALALALELLLANRQFSPKLDAVILFEMAELFSRENDPTCDISLSILSEKLWIDGAEWPDFDYFTLLNFCAAQFADDDIPFDRKVAAASVVFAVLGNCSLHFFDMRYDLIPSAFAVTEAGISGLVSGGITAAYRLVSENATDGLVLHAVTEFLKSVDTVGDEDQQAKAKTLLSAMQME
jgi:hypothetical protein